MKEITYVPKTEGFSGEILLNVPSYKERMALLKGLGVKMGPDGATSMDDQLEMAEKMLAKFSTLVLKVDLKYEDQVFTDIEELSYYKEGQDVIQELQGVLTNGLTLGKR